MKNPQTRERGCSPWDPEPQSMEGPSGAALPEPRTALGVTPAPGGPAPHPEAGGKEQVLVPEPGEPGAAAT